MDGHESADRFGIDTSVAHSARVHNYWLGGKDNFAADRATGDAVIAAYPGIVKSVRANRAFLARAARFLAAEAGIRQFLDIGTGIPAADNTHEVVLAAAPDARVVYVDYDPVVLLHARTLLTSDVSGAIDYIDADLRDPGTILRQAARTLDFSRPVAIMLIAIMHLIGDADDPYGLVAQLTAAVPPGSYLALSQVASDIEPEQMAEAARRYNRSAYEQQRHRTHAEVSRFFDGLELVAPGVVAVQNWRPGSEIEASAKSAMWGGVGRKRLAPVVGPAGGDLEREEVSGSEQPQDVPVRRPDPAPGLVVVHVRRVQPQNASPGSQLAATGRLDVLHPVSILRAVRERDDVAVLGRERVDRRLIGAPRPPAAVHDQPEARHPRRNMPDHAVQADLVPLRHPGGNRHGTSRLTRESPARKL